MSEHQTETDSDLEAQINRAQAENDEAYAQAMMAINRGPDGQNEHNTPFTAADMSELRGRLEGDKQLDGSANPAEVHHEEERRRHAMDILTSHGAEIVMANPGSVRVDASTNEPVPPLIFLQGLGGDGKLPFHVQRLAETGQRQVIALNYGGQLRPERNERIQTEGGDQIPGTYQDTAEDLKLMVDALGLGRVDIAALSVGAPAAVLFADAHPAQVDRLQLIQPGGIDMMTSRQRKLASIREVVKYISGRKKSGTKESEPDGYDLKTSVSPGKRAKNMLQQRRDILGTRMGEAIAALDPRIQVALTGDKHGEVYPADELYAATSRLPDNVRFIATDWKRGVHALGYSDVAISGVNDVFLEMEQRRKDGTWSKKQEMSQNG